MWTMKSTFGVCDLLLRSRTTPPEPPGVRPGRTRRTRGGGGRGRDLDHSDAGRLPIIGAERDGDDKTDVGQRASADATNLRNRQPYARIIRPYRRSGLASRYLDVAGPSDRPLPPLPRQPADALIIVPDHISIIILITFDCSLGEHDEGVAGWASTARRRGGPG